MIVLLGASGYIGEAFASELKRRDEPFIPVSRKSVDYTNYQLLVTFLKQNGVTFLINAAGYTGKPNVDACENARAETLNGNTILPITIAHACSTASIPWGHVSSGCIYAGAKIATPHEGFVIEKDLTKPELNERCRRHDPAVIGFNESDEPNFTFRRPPCSFYSGTKALAEENIFEVGQSYIWRLRIPFDEFDNSRNYLSKIQRYPKVYDNVNSLSHRGDYVSACLDLWKKRAPFGIYNVTNPGYVSTRTVAGMIEEILKPSKRLEFWANDEEFYCVAAKTPRSNCILDVSKLLKAGVHIRPVEEALYESLQNWKVAP